MVGVKDACPFSGSLLILFSFYQLNQRARLSLHSRRNSNKQARAPVLPVVSLSPEFLHIMYYFVSRKYPPDLFGENPFPEVLRLSSAQTIAE